MLRPADRLELSLRASAARAAPPATRRAAEVWVSLALCCVLAGFSVWRQGFAFGVNNNVFHVPIVLGWASLPQFRDDALVQSLHAFISPVYPALALVVDETTMEAGFLALHVATRVVTFLALFRLVGLFGVEGLVARGSAVALVALSSPAYGYSSIGGGGLLLDYFSHSELAQAVALLALVEAGRGRIAPAGLLAGLAFVVNAFVGAWLVPALTAAALLRLARERFAARSWQDAALGAIAFAACAAPIVAWLFSLPAQPVEFDYRAYLHGYAGFHFFIGAAPPQQVFLTLALLGSALLALFALPRGARAAALLLLGSLLAVFAAGILVGEVASNRLLLNLHLLRVDTLVTWVALVLVAAAAASAIEARRPLSTMLAGALPFALMRLSWSPVQFLLVSAALPVAAAFDARSRRMQALAGRILPARSVLFGLLLLSLAAAHLHGWHDRSATRAVAAGQVPLDRQFEGTSPRAPEWAETLRWIAQHTPPEAVFLTPPSLADFRIGARRSTWVDSKQGASAMWAPGTHAEWRRRLDEVAALTSPDAVMAYAERNGVACVVLDKRRWREEEIAPLRSAIPFENRWFAVVRPIRP